VNRYQSLDVADVLNNVAASLSLDSARQEILNLKVEYNPLIIERRIKETSEALAILNKGSTISFNGINDISSYLNSSLRGEVLLGNELMQCSRFHHHCQRLIQELTYFDEAEILRDYLESLKINEKVFKEIDTALDLNGNVKRGASKQLNKLFGDLDSLNANIGEKAQQFLKDNAKSLQEESVYTRNNRVSFLVKNSDKNKFAGYRYGGSGSGQATYVEPQLFVEMNNQRSQLEEAIEREIHQILKKLTLLLSEIAIDYLNNYESINRLAIIFAKAEYAYRNKGIMAKFSRNEQLSLIKVRHPLLSEAKAIKNDYHFYEEYCGICISGSNTGGKTVSLKTIALSILMTYVGLPVFAESATIPFFDSLYIDMQDNQSLNDSLSTFSSHLKNLNDIFKAASKNSLILIDELASGTDPKEAEALSLAIIDKFIDNNIKFVLTTHYDGIKKYSYENDHILLASVGFDEIELKPTYIYHEGLIGDSNALTIAEKYLDDKILLNNAQNYLKKQRSDADELLAKLNQEKAIIEKEHEELNLKIESLEKERANFEKERENFNNRYRNKESELIIELEEIYQQKMNEAEELLKKIRKEEKSQNAKSIYKELESKHNEIQVAKPQEKLNIGDQVRIEGNTKTGIIDKIEKDNAIVKINNMSLRVKLNKLEKIGATVKKKVNTYIPRQRKYVANEINLVGMHVEEALILLEKYLSDAFGAHKNKVKIIHGVGTQALRKAIQSNLKKYKYISKFYDGDYFDGGLAVTIVEFNNEAKR